MAKTGWDYRVEIGKNISRYRLESGISQREMERKYCISRTYLCKLESGKHCPSIETLRLLAKAFGITPSMFFFDVEGNEIPYM